MNKKLRFALFGLSLTTISHAQFSASDIEFWVGSGTDSTMLVVDFNDSTHDSSYAWGYLHDGSATGEDLLNALHAADVNFTVDLSGGFLNDIYYGNHQGVGGSPDYWSTWDGPSIAGLDTNSGIQTTLISGGWFGVSYTDFAPALKPDSPLAAYPPNVFTLSDADYYVGSGSDTAILVIDFLDGSDTSSFAWGYLFSDSTTGEEMLQDIAAADSLLQVSTGGGFLNDITYQTFAGIGGSPNFWATWSATNYGNWEMNDGIGTTVKPSEFFGATYTDWSPALRPGIPASGENTIGLGEAAKKPVVDVFPQPAHDRLTVEFPEGFTDNGVSIFSLGGKMLLTHKTYGSKAELDLSSLSPGVYILKSAGTGQKIIIQ